MRVEELPFLSSVAAPSLGDRANNCSSGDDLPLFAMIDLSELCGYTCCCGVVVDSFEFLLI